MAVYRPIGMEFSDRILCETAPRHVVRLNRPLWPGRGGYSTTAYVGQLHGGRSCITAAGRDRWEPLASGALKSFKPAFGKYPVQGLIPGFF